MAEPSSEKSLKCGLVSIVGRPNVGKSTLLNRIVGEKVAIVSRVPQTTRNQVRGIYNDERGQIVFVDTPGLHAGRDRLDQFMNKSAYSTVDDADVVIHLVDSEERVGQEEERLAQKLSRLSAPLVLGLNKVDLKGRYLSEYISLWERVRGKPVTAFEKFTLLPLSGKTGLHIDKLLEIVFSCLPEGPALYPRDAVTDVPQRMAIADILREKFFELLRDEIPHSLAVIVEDMQARGPSLTHIRALVLLERDSQKIIVIGKDGQNLKKVGTSARIELEALLSKKVFLEIFVKSKKNWRDNGSLLEEMGYVSL